MKVILLFTDFDGVFHPWFPRADRTPEQNELWSYLPRFERVIRDFPEVRLVITSNWRINRSLAELREPFSKDIQSRIIGKTGQRDPRQPAARHQEVIDYLRRNGGGAWLAIDDVSQNYRPGAPLILCDDQFDDREEGLLRSALLTCRSCLR